MGTETSSHGTDAPHDLNAFIFDLDGVIWRGNAPIEGAVESVARLKAAGKRCLFCTNNSRQMPEDFATRLREVGIEATGDDVMTSAMATVLYMESQFTGPFTAYVIGEEGLVTALRRTGAIITISPIIPQRSDLNVTHGEVDCVIVGIDATFSYHKMRLAQRLILSGARFIATNRDSTFPTPHGVVPGAGAIVASIETATGVSPIVLGKPQPLMIQLLAQKFALKIEETALVGDRLDTDMTAAHRAGAQGLFVATGVHTIEQARHATGEQKPDGIYQNLPALCEAFIGKTVNAADAVATAAVFAAAPVVAPLAGSAILNGSLSNGAVPDKVEFDDVAQTGMVEAMPVAAAPIDETFIGPVNAADVQAPPVAGAPDTIFDWNTESPVEETEAAPQESESQGSTAQDAPFSSFSLKSDDDTTEAPAPPEPAMPEPADSAADLNAAFGFSLADAPAAATETTEPVATETMTAPVMASAEPAPVGEPDAEGRQPEHQKLEGDDNWWESLDKLI